MEVKEGYKKTEVGLIPKEWEIVKLNEGIKLSSGHHILAKHCNTKGKGIPYLTGPADFPKGIIQHSKYTESPSTICKQNDILITVKGSGAGTMVIGDSEYCISRQLMAIHITLWNPFYIYSVLKQDQSIFSATATGLIPGLSRQDILEKMIPIPPTIQEQTAIATALSDADALINSLEKLIAKKQAIKQGTMQLLLTGKKRLPGFSDEWEEKKLGAFINIRKGQLITDSTRTNGNVPVIAGGIRPAYYHNKPNRFGKTITISGSGASAGYVSFHDYPIFASDCSTIEESNDYSIEYIFYLLQSLQHKIYGMQTGGAQPHIHPSDLNFIEVSLPKKEEQFDIANILSNMNSEIAALVIKLGKYKKLKQGMMQNLLTGKIRLI